ncbi:hypothetical protein [Caldicoprobacter faecalis]|nr:hypothetical protein [Caldicoprobacter faecalis]
MFGIIPQMGLKNKLKGVMIMLSAEYRVILEDIFERTWFDVNKMTLADIALLKVIAENNFEFVEQEPETKEYLEKFKGFNIIKYYFLTGLSPEERFQAAMRKRQDEA